jgi:peptidoglycan/LPS O-acetylase OafA/YrhL
VRVKLVSVIGGASSRRADTSPERAPTNARAESMTAPNAVEAEGHRFLGHVPALDGMRGIAVLLVLASHVVLVFYPGSLFTVVPGSPLGVDIFFVLSGFLITSLLLNEQRRTNRVSMGGFYSRRALRLLPALVALLAVHFVYAAVTGLSLALEGKTATVSLLYVANWYMVLGHDVAGGFQHVWSLSVEEQFYLVWPAITVAVLTYKRSTPFIVAAFVAAIAAVVLWRMHLWEPGTNYFGVQKFYYRTDVRADSLLVGALTAHLWSRRKTPTAGLGVAATISLLFLVWCVANLSENDGFLYYGGFTLIAIATAFMILAVVDGGWFLTRAFTWTPLRAVGRVSYGLYLWHLPVFFAVARYTDGWPAWERAALALAITVVCTLSSWYLVEVPFLRWKDTISHRQVRVATAA